MVSGGKYVAAIGNFDGVHVGHRQLLERTTAFAATIGADAAAVTFEPHPRRFFRPADPPFLITTSRRRDELLRASGARAVFTLVFDAETAALTPDAFVNVVLKDRLRLAGVATGAEFRFGRGRSGDAAGLARLARAAGLEALIITPATEQGRAEKIGSSAIRSAIAAGDMAAAAAMLGRPWSVEGVVSEGRRLGRTIGFPTANMALGELIEPRRGVYAVRARIGDASVSGVANFGLRPTVGDAAASLLEAHFFDWSGDLYGRVIDVEFHAFLREERRFDSLDALKDQIARDAAAARAVFTGG